MQICYTCEIKRQEIKLYTLDQKQMCHDATPYDLRANARMKSIFAHLTSENQKWVNHVSFTFWWLSTCEKQVKCALHVKNVLSTMD